jgi:hypothetical protein
VLLEVEVKTGVGGGMITAGLDIGRCGRIGAGAAIAVGSFNGMSFGGGFGFIRGKYSLDAKESGDTARILSR